MLLDNPFYILDATTRLTKQQILDLADEKSLELDHDACDKARIDLTLPKNRLTAELDWFLGLSAAAATDLINRLKQNDKNLYSQAMPNLAYINIMHDLLNTNTFNASQLKFIINKLSDIFENINIDDILYNINQDRAVAKFPVVNDLDAVERALKHKQETLISMVINNLNELETSQMIELATSIAKQHTDDSYPPHFIAGLIDLYALKVQTYLESQIELINDEINTIKESAKHKSDESQIQNSVNELLQTIKRWDQVAQPIQLIKMTQGIDEPISTNLAKKIRSLGISLYNDYGYLKISQMISNEIKDIFAELPEMAEQIQNDVDTLDELEEKIKLKKERQENELKNAMREVRYSADIGLININTFSIYNGVIEYKGDKCRLENVSGIIYGGTSHSINGIPTGTTYKIVISESQGNSIIVETRRSQIYYNIVEILNRTAGLKIMLGIINLIQTEGFKLGDCKIFDDGVVIYKNSGWLTPSTQQKFPWSDIKISSSNGIFTIQSKSQYSYRVDLPYLNKYNAHYLEQILTIFLKSNCNKISQIVNK